MAYRLRPRSTGGFEVLDGATRLLTFHAPVEAPPPERAGNAKAGKDAEEARRIGAAAVVDVRALMENGALNNEMHAKGQTKYLCRNPRHLNQMVDTIFYELAELEAEEPRPFPVQMAAYAVAAMEVRGGVCSMLAHVGLGFLTLRGKPGMQAALVVDKNFDHSYVVVGYKTSTWFTVDPWTGQTYVIPWADGYFPREDVSHHYLVDIHGPVTVPYGVTFDDTLLAGSIRAGRNGRAPGVLEMDNHYVHVSNVAEEKAHLYQPVLTPFAWGDDVGRQSPGSEYDIFG